METETYPIVIIDWLDHSGSCGWKSKLDYPKAPIYTIRTLGWLVYEDSQKVVIHNNQVMDNDNDDTGGESVIIKKNIINKWILEVDE